MGILVMVGSVGLVAAWLCQVLGSQSFFWGGLLRKWDLRTVSRNRSLQTGWAVIPMRLQAWWECSGAFGLGVPGAAVGDFGGVSG